MPGFMVCGAGGPADSQVETARRHRYRLIMAQAGLGELCVYARKISRPTPALAEIKMHYGQDEIKFAGKTSWQPIEIKFYEVIKSTAVGGGGGDGCSGSPASNAGVSAVSEALYKWWAQATLNIATSTLRTVYKGQANIMMLTGGYEVVWRYDLLGVWPSKVRAEELDYAESAISEVTVEVSFDKATERAM